MNKQLLLRLQKQTRARLDGLKKRATDDSISADDLKTIQDQVDQEVANLQDISSQLADLDGGGAPDDSDDSGTDDSTRGGEDNTDDTSDDDNGTNESGNEPKNDNKRGVNPVDPDQRQKVLQSIARSKAIQVTHDEADSDEQIRSAFANAVLGRADGKQLRSLGVDSGKGSITIPKVVSKDIITYTEEQNLLRKYGTVVQTSNTQGYPVLVKKMEANQHKKERADNDPIPETDIAFDEVLLAPSEFDAIATFSQKLVAMSSVNVPKVVTDELTKAYSRKESIYMFNGTADKPEDTNPGALATKAVPFYESKKVDVTVDGFAQNLYTQLVHLKNKIVTSLLPGSIWIVNRPALTILESMTDTTGRPLLHEAVDGIGYTLLGYRVDLTDNATGATADSPVFYFGNFKAFYIQDVQGSMAVQPLYELYALTNRVGMKIYNIVDGQLIYSPYEPAVYKYEPGVADPKA
jgi:HK97 family phage major capsid protein